MLIIRLGLYYIKLLGQIINTKRLWDQNQISKAYGGTKLQTPHIIRGLEPKLLAFETRLFSVST